ncbi:MAG: trypsin-like peptidase domain-containing protein, partial [Planctomycetales bacterium]|nr:trypsin-like peptidase domain-containing protein [Planctomycetales bacterium]
MRREAAKMTGTIVPQHLSRPTWCGRCLLLTLAVVGVLVSASHADVPTLPAELEAAEQQRIAAIAKASRVTVAVFSPEKSGGGGSGVVISQDGYALTNFHVVQPCGTYMRCGMNDGKLYDAVLVGIDPTGDLAMIQLLGRDDFPVAEFGDSDEVQVGDSCFAVGNPFLLATDLNPTVTYGVVSGVRRYQPPAGNGILEYTDCIQTDAAINPGNSGGPLFDAAGRLIGINGRGSFEKRGRVNVGVGYAISLTQVKHFLGMLKSGRIIDHATLGATVATDETGSVVVTNILDSSDAYRRGLRYSDHIVSLAGRKIDTANTFKNVLGILPRGWRVPLVYRHNDETIETYVRLAGVHSPEVLLRLAQQGLGPPSPPAPPDPDENEEEPSDEKDSKDDHPDQPRRRPERATPAQAKSTELPPVVKERFDARRGYANYYYNRLQRDRVWDLLKQKSDV